MDVSIMDMSIDSEDNTDTPIKEDNSERVKEEHPPPSFKIKLYFG